jgi:hypothetical protein
LPLKLPKRTGTKTRKPEKIGIIGGLADPVGWTVIYPFYLKIKRREKMSIRINKLLDFIILSSFTYYKKSK